jgi:hypothetical protein
VEVAVPMILFNRLAEGVRSLALFLWQIKLWWSVPLVILFFIYALLIIKGSQMPVSPFIYTLF